MSKYFLSKKNLKGLNLFQYISLMYNCLKRSRACKINTNVETHYYLSTSKLELKYKLLPTLTTR